MSEAEDKVRLAINASVVRMAFDAILTLVVGVVGYVVVGIRNDLVDLKTRDQAFQQELAIVKERLPVDYVRNERYTLDVLELKSLMLRIENRLNDHNDRLGREKGLLK